MLEDSVFYNGMDVPKEAFRVFIYGIDGAKKLVNSWIEYEAHLSTGLWFSKLSDVPEKETIKEDLIVEGEPKETKAVPIEKSKPKARKK